MVDIDNLAGLNYNFYIPIPGGYGVELVNKKLEYHMTIDSRNMLDAAEGRSEKALSVTLNAAGPDGESAGADEQLCQVVLDLEGMSCAACAMRIEKGLKKVPGVKDAVEIGRA